ncbi:MAG: class I SAM-dependent methyltransferase [Parcubacteria group bacterium]|nr:class I SAM-dependent methyltransferase [Parcubacteria group bacterium]
MLCTLCSNNKAASFLDLGKQPLANKYPTEEMIKTEDFFPLVVFFCPECKNVELGEKVSRSRMFEDYYYLSSVNPGLVRYFEGLAKKLAGARFVVDIGSNDGILLKPLKELGVSALGIEPSVNVSKIANDQGLTTITSFFNADTVERVAKEWGKPDVIVASSIFTHLEDPHTFIDDVKALLSDDGSFIIEVEYIGNILRDTQFERFYLDRIFYYSLSSLKNLFEAHGMSIVDVEEIEPHGGSIKVTFQKTEHAGDPSPAVTRMLQDEAMNLNPEALGAFKDTVDGAIAAFRAKLEEYKKQGLRVAGYGAPARVATITNYGNIGPSLIEYIVDDSPLKQNKFSPGMHIPIVPGSYLEGERPDVLVVFAFEYFDDIRKKVGEGYRFLLPIPPREII